MASQDVGDGDDPPYDPALHVELMAAEYLTKPDRRRVRTCLETASSALGPGETIIALTDAVLDERVGLCLVTDQRLIFLDEDQAGATTLSVDLDDNIRATALAEGELADVVVTGAEGEIVLESVGDLVWASQLATSIEEGRLVDSLDLDDAAAEPEEICPGCGEALEVVSHGTLRCPYCRLLVELDEVPGRDQSLAELGPDVFVPADPEVVAERLVSGLARQGAVITTRDASTITGYLVVDRRPNPVVVALLCILSCGLGLIYFLIRQRHEQLAFSVQIAEVEGGTEVALSGLNGAVAMAATELRSLMADLEASAHPRTKAALWDRLYDLNPRFNRTEDDLRALLDAAEVKPTDLDASAVAAVATSKWASATTLTSDLLDQAVHLAHAKAPKPERVRGSGGHT